MRTMSARASEDDPIVSDAAGSVSTGLPYVSTVSSPQRASASLPLTLHGDAKLLVPYPTNFSVWCVG